MPAVSKDLTADGTGMMVGAGFEAGVGAGVVVAAAVDEAADHLTIGNGVMTLAGIVIAGALKMNTGVEGAVAAGVATEIDSIPVVLTRVDLVRVLVRLTSRRPSLRITSPHQQYLSTTSPHQQPINIASLPQQPRSIISRLHQWPLSITNPRHQLIKLYVFVSHQCFTLLTVHQGTGDRLEQARKVQQLLAALKQPQNGAAQSPTMQQGPPAPGPPPNSLGMPPPPPHQNPYYAPPPVQQPAAPYPPPPGPNTNPYAQMPSQTPTPQPGQMHTGMPGLPPNILALLQQSQGQQGQGTAPQQMQTQYGMPPPPPQSMIAPPPMSSMPPGAPQPGTPNYQQLMAILVSRQDSLHVLMLTALHQGFAEKVLKRQLLELLLVCSCAYATVFLRHLFLSGRFFLVALFVRCRIDMCYVVYMQIQCSAVPTTNLAPQMPTYLIYDAPGSWI
jgi:hypothetical protein